MLQKKCKGLLNNQLKIKEPFYNKNQTKTHINDIIMEILIQNSEKGNPLLF
jgi:predicted secreted protein